MVRMILEDGTQAPLYDCPENAQFLNGLYNAIGENEDGSFGLKLAADYQISEDGFKVLEDDEGTN